jgi:hypothetical protein
MRRPMASVRSAVLLAAVVALVIFGPPWPDTTTELTCGESVQLHAVFQDMSACVVAMHSGCSCAVRSHWVPPLYYLALVPVLFITAIWMADRSVARGVAIVAVVLWTAPFLAWPAVWVYGAASRMPTFFRSMAIRWSRLVFFAPALHRAGPSDGAVVPHQWVYVSQVAFWALAASAFGLLARRVKSFAVVLVLAALFVGATVCLVWLVVPLFNWRILLENP